MSQDVYRELLEVMKKRGGPYAGKDIPEFFAMVEELFTPEEAEVNNAMPKGPLTAESMSEIMNRGKEELDKTLEAMANKGLCVALKMDGPQFYMSAPFMPGILEFQFMPGTITERDKKLARLIHDYERAFDALAPARETMFPTTRVITVDRTVDSENTVRTHDQVQTYIDQNDFISVSTCFCRHAAVLRDEDIHGMPNDVCMQFGAGAQFSAERLGARLLTKEEAREVIQKAEEAGLIHMSQNTAEGVGFICNCDRWHCGAVKTALSMSKPGVFFNSGFEPVFDADECIACDICIEGCPPEALTMGDDDVPVVNLDRCFGCAVCATSCPDEAIKMVNKAGYPEIPKDPKALREAISGRGM
jgi:Pyruvate/2-oxoacid:ferredoxin oxidoreductase delta subunit